MDFFKTLNQLGKLLDKGLLTQAEFDVQKKALLLPDVLRIEGRRQIEYVLLGFFLGRFGVHNFYVERYIKGIFQMLLFVVGAGLCFSIWDAIQLQITPNIGAILLLAFVADLSILYDIFFVNKDAKKKPFIPAKLAKNIAGVLFFIKIFFWFLVIYFLKALQAPLPFKPGQIASILL